MTNVTFPKIGIRPTIDGRRRGIRESLEEQTMNMAHSVAKLLESTLKYPDGSPVQTVISGDSMVQSVLGRFISQPSWQLTRKREFQLSVFTGMMYKMLMTPQSLKM